MWNCPDAHQLMHNLQSGVLLGVANGQAVSTGYLERSARRAIIALDALVIQGLIEVADFKVLGEPKDYRVELRLTSLGRELLANVSSGSPMPDIAGGDDCEHLAPVVASSRKNAQLTCVGG